MVVAWLLTLAVVVLLVSPPGSRYFQRGAAVTADEEGRLPTQPVGWPWPATPVYTVPPGYMICPDPSRHLPAPPPGGEQPSADEQRPSTPES